VLFYRKDARGQYFFAFLVVPLRTLRFKLKIIFSELSQLFFVFLRFKNSFIKIISK